MVRRPTAPPRTLADFLKGPPKVSQKALADAVGVDQSTISLIKHRKRFARGRVAIRLHHLTGVPLREFLAPDDFDVPERIERDAIER